jgi:hypothetical protein
MTWTGPGGGDDHICSHGRVGRADALDQRSEEAELHEDQNIREGNAREGRGEPSPIVDELEPADRKTAEDLL